MPPPDEAFVKRELEKCSIAYTPTSNSPVPIIRTLEDLDRNLPDMCKSILKTLSTRNLENTYQRCLKLDLEEAGVMVLDEVEMRITYKGKKVATRRCDLILMTSHDGKLAIVELKAVVNHLTGEHRSQLEYYMRHFKIDVGYLINFPHDTGFPEETILCGDGSHVLSTRTLRARNKDRDCDIVKLERLKDDNVGAKEGKTRTFENPRPTPPLAASRGACDCRVAAGAPCTCACAAAAPAAKQVLVAPGHVDKQEPKQKGPGTAAAAAPAAGSRSRAVRTPAAIEIITNPETGLSYGTTRKGEPCQNCIRYKKLCSQHQPAKFR